MRLAMPFMLMMGSLAACAAAPPLPAAVERSILAGSAPAAGSTVAGPVDALVLQFEPPARLLEVTVTDAAGQAMPMMVSAVGEVREYSLPLAGLEAGGYSVDWRASAGGAEHRGRFAFTVR